MFLLFSRPPSQDYCCLWLPLAASGCSGCFLLPLGASGCLWVPLAASGRPICQVLFKCFNSFKNPLQSGALWSFGRLVAQEADLPIPFQMLQFFYKPFTKRSTLELRPPHGSGGRSAKSFPNASNPLQFVYQTEHLPRAASGCLWLPLADFGCFWLPLAACGCLWLPLAASGCF